MHKRADTMGKEDMQSNFIIIHLGGSVVVPHISDEGGIDVGFLKKFHEFVKQELQKELHFIIVVGGGKTARAYQKSASEVVKISDWDLDWIGIHATRLNAHLMRTIFEKEAYPVVIDHDPEIEEVQALKASHKQLFFASGWRPGWSTDYIAVRLAQKFETKTIIIAKDTPFVYSKDPKKYSDAKVLKQISWQDYKKLIPVKWTPGLSTPFDPVATRLAEKFNLVVKVLDAANLSNFKKAVEDKPFVGTVIS